MHHKYFKPRETGFALNNRYTLSFTLKHCSLHSATGHFISRISRGNLRRNIFETSSFNLTCHKCYFVTLFCHQIASIIRELTRRKINISWLSTFNKYCGYRASTRTPLCQVNLHNFHNVELRKRINTFLVMVFWTQGCFVLLQLLKFSACLMQASRFHEF